MDGTGDPVGLAEAGGSVAATTLVLAAPLLGTGAVLQGLFGPWLPSWLAMPILVLKVAAVAVGAFIGGRRLRTWRRRRWSAVDSRATWPLR